jgi:hypothetical protein
LTLIDGCDTRRGDRMKGLALFWRAFRTRPSRALAGLTLEYAGFFAAVSLALGLIATRIPLAIVDRLFGVRLRERFIELVVRFSPG